MGEDVVSLTRERLDLAQALAQIGHLPATATDQEAGALVSFCGIVRATEGEGRITHLEYDQYEGMAKRQLEVLVDEARGRWTLRRILVLHRLGSVPVGETAVIIAVSAGHREEAFSAARFLIDEVKKRVPIWKSASEA